jgi:cysteine-rich repeat protein
MRLRTLGIAALLGTALVQTGGAVVAPKGAEAPTVSAERGGRTHRTTVWTRSGSSSVLAHKLAATGLAGWTAQWDRDTDVPLRMWGKSDVVAGSVADPAIAEVAARQFLAQHLQTLAPGALVGDFELVSNELHGDIRSVGFIQRSNGVKVLGGSIGFAFKADRLAMVSSTALPYVSVAVPSQRLAPNTVRSAAINWLAVDGHFVAARAFATSTAPAGEQVIVPTVRPRRAGRMQIDYKLAEQLQVDAVGDGVGTWTVWVDAATAAPIQRKSGIRYASARVLFDVPERGPHGNRVIAVPHRARFTVNGTQTIPNATDGTITWDGTADGSVVLGVVGDLVSIVNRGGAPRITETVTVAPDQIFTWSKLATEFEDAQLTSYVYANKAKEFTRERLNPRTSVVNWLNEQLGVHVNEDDTCNAFSTGDDIHFFRRGGGCENTGRLADVVYHEFGHSLHAHSIIPGVGDFDGALSEGVSDVLASAITNDSGMGRGFFMNNAPLRELNPPTDKKWGVHTTGQVHDDGEIIGGTLWDLRKALETSMGVEAGYEQFLKIFYAIMQRAADIPSSYPEALLADDDDGDLTNGTPHQCDIDQTFAAHGLSDPTLALGLKAPTRDIYKISINAEPPPSASACPKPTITGAKMTWRIRGGKNAELDMASIENGFVADIPEQIDGTTVLYKVVLTLSDANTVTFPNNPADEYYEFFVGPVEPIQCFDFENGDVSAWNKSTDWQVGPPEGLGGDPSEAFAGTNAFGTDLSNDGLYRNRSMSVAESPEIDTGGAQFVRLQYRRWLGVEDGFFDRARIFANNAQVWANLASPDDPQAGGIHHIDREWVFQDIDVTTQAKGGKLKLRFELESDEGLNFGGWTVDDVCVVRAFGAGLTCGNGRIDDGETCDDGNRIDGDGCDSACGGDGSGDGGGCCSTGSGGAGALGLSVLTLGLVLRRRKRRGA